MWQWGDKNSLEILNRQCNIQFKKTKKDVQKDINIIETKLKIEYYRQIIIPIISRMIDYYQPIIKVSPSNFRTKNMKTRWGTCNTKSQLLWFNVQLGRFSEPYIEYVVVHEMVHLRERYHNKRFYQLVAQAMPRWEQYHKALKSSSCFIG